MTGPRGMVLGCLVLERDMGHLRNSLFVVTCELDGPASDIALNSFSGVMSIVAEEGDINYQQH